MIGSTIINSGSDNMIARGHQLYDYIPQRPPMVMVDELVEVAETKFVSRLTVESGNIFVDNGLLREPGIIENIAQTAAAGVGYHQISKGEPVKLGFIAAIRNLEILNLPLVGRQLQTTVEVVNKVLDMTIIKGQVVDSGNIIATCEMRIFIKL